jgi:hypothetical protein
MPKLKDYNKKPQKKKIAVKELTCTMCGQTQKPSMHYQSFNPIHATGYLPYCKKCLRDMCIDNLGNIGLDNFKTMLKLIDRPFIYSVFKSSCEDKNDTIGTYMKNIALNYKKNGWEDSIFEPQFNKKVDFVESNQIDFDVTNEMIIRWGNKHEKEDYIQLEQFYNQMKRDNKIETAQDEAYLKKLAVISLKLDKALENDDYDEANKLGNLFSKYMGDSQFRAMDKSDASKTGGLRTFSQVYGEIEKDGFIPPWEEYRNLKGLNQDLVDKTIMYILNYTLKLNKISQMIEPPSDTPKVETDD